MWTIGDRVWVNRLQDAFWYPGTIRHIQDDRYFVIYDDGEDGFVQEPQMEPFQLNLGEAVEVCPEKSSHFEPARVIDRQGEQFQVELTEEGRLAWVPPGRLRKMLRTTAPVSLGSTSVEFHEPTDWTIGSRVFACGMDLYWYPGTVFRSQDDLVLVALDDGSIAPVLPDRIRPFQLQEGETVEARFQAGGNFYPGVVDRIEGDVLHIQYDDGDEENSLVRFVRLQRDEWFPPSEPLDLGPGDRILGCWYDGLWYPGIILTIEGQRLHVLFDDNDQAHLTWDKIRPMDIAVGDTVMCRKVGGPAYYPGEITQMRGERILVQYDDGQEEWSSVRLVRVER